MKPPPLVYALYCGDLYGTERMAVVTSLGLKADFAPSVLAPAGDIHAEAARLGLATACYAGIGGLARAIAAQLAAAPTMVFLTTRLEQSIVVWALNLWFRREVHHRLVVHGGGGKNVYRRNRWLAPLGVRFIAVSDYVRDCLVDNGIAATRIDVAENFLSRAQGARVPRRAAFHEHGVRRVAVVTRLEPYKRVGLLIDALDATPALSRLQFDVYGHGSELPLLRERARRHETVRFHGFTADVVERLREHDLLLHTAPREPFGLVILEAMAAGLPVLVPDTGGPASIVAHGGGWCYRADDDRALARSLLMLAETPASDLNAKVEAGGRELATRFDEAVAIERYRRLLQAP